MTEADLQTPKRGLRRTLLELAIPACLLAFPSSGFIQKYAGVSGVLAYLVAVIVALLVGPILLEKCAGWMNRHFRVLLATVAGSMLVGFLVLHPLEDGKGPGKSSDRDEGLELAVSRLAAGKYPYYPAGNPEAGPLSVLPGSILLAAPFVAIGSVGCQNVFWLVLLIGALARWCVDKATAIALVILTWIISPAALYEFVSGGDLIANSVFTALFFLLAIAVWTAPKKPAWQLAGSALLLGIGVASRPNFMLILPLFGMLVWKIVGFRRAFVVCAVVGITAAALILPFYLSDPAGFTPLMARQKLAIADRTVPWASTAILLATVLAAMIAALQLFRSGSTAPYGAFFRWATLVTLVPMILAVAFASWQQGGLNFEFMRDRFGLMYGGFALLGWGGCLLKSRDPADAACPPTSKPLF